MEVHRSAGQTVTKSPAGSYTGDSWAEHLAVAGAPSHLHVDRITFAPGARTAWHAHPNGQVLVVLAGVGRAQADGGPVRELYPGDSVVTAAGERHWHGAAPDRTFEHLAIQPATPDGEQASWAEPVTDEQYATPRSEAVSYQSVNPYTEQVLQTFPATTDAELEEALARSSAVYRDDWRHCSTAERATVVGAAARMLREQADRLAEMAVREMGKRLSDAHHEVGVCVDILSYYAEETERLLAPRTIEGVGTRASIRYEPLGPIFCVEPWNFPFYQLARVAGPQLMAGNTIVMKPAAGVPECALAFEQLLLDAGLPPGAYTTVLVDNDQVARVIADPRVAGVALTGSDRAGSAVAGEAGRAVKKSTMELGGSDAFVVREDADLDLAVRLAVAGRMANTGQACAGSKRFVVHTSVADEFVGRFAAELEALAPGDPLDPATTLGPLSSRQALDTVLGQIASATDAGATVVTGGKRLDRTGFFLAPTILTDVAPDNPVFHQELFAPVAMVFRVGDDDEAVAVANDSPYGLGGSVITRDVEAGEAVAARMETGMVFVNGVVIDSPRFPFGGVKASGYGRELAADGILEFVNGKVVVIA